MRTALACLASAALATAATLSLSSAGAAPHGARVPRSSDEILRAFVDDFRFDRAKGGEARVFGVEVEGEGAWTIDVTGERDDDGWIVELREGLPEEPTFYYTTDADTLAAIDMGELNAITAQGKAFPDDPAPMQIEWLEGSEPHDVNAFSFHFWTRGFPEIVPFRDELTRVVHGVDNVAFYYQPGFRSIWSSIKKGQRANNGPGQPIVVPFPAMIIAISGRAQGLVAGERVEVAAGEMALIPPMTPYEWWNDDDEPAEAILLFFGEGA